MRFISEAQSALLVDAELARRSAELALVAAADPDSHSFPPVLGHGADPLNRFSIKSASTAALAGLKLGTYWHANDRLDLPRHSSFIVLLDQRVGRVKAVIEASRANAYRTAAVNGLAVERLSRPDAETLAIFGAGHQAAFECAAVMRVRPIRRILVVNRDAGRALRLIDDLRGLGVAAQAADARTACSEADVIVTVTGARSPLFPADAVRPGAHVSAMGADAAGKQELPPELLLRAALFCDSVDQALVLGELQHAAAAVDAGRIERPTNLGEVLAGRHVGRRDRDEITVFDSSGLALQDLFLGALLLEAADRQNMTPALL